MEDTNLIYVKYLIDERNRRPVAAEPAWVLSERGRVKGEGGPLGAEEDEVVGAADDGEPDAEEAVGDLGEAPAPHHLHRRERDPGVLEGGEGMWRDVGGGVE